MTVHTCVSGVAGLYVRMNTCYPGISSVLSLRLNTIWHWNYINIELCFKYLPVNHSTSAVMRSSINDVTFRGMEGGFEMPWHNKSLNLLKPTGHAMHQQFNIQQLYALPTLYLCFVYLSENKQRLVPLRA